MLSNTSFLLSLTSLKIQYSRSGGPILQMRELRHKELNYLHKIAQLVTVKWELGLKP